MRMVPLATSALLLMAFCLPVAEVKLVYRFTKGDQYEWSQVTSQVTKQDIPGMGELTVNLEIRGAMLLRIDQVSSAGARVEAKYTRLKVSSNAPLMNLNMDSESDEVTLNNKMVKSMVGKVFYFTLSEHGKISGLEGTENLFSGLNDLGLDEASLANARQLMKQTLSPESLKASLQMGLLTYPEKNINPGERWTSKSTLAMNFPMEVSNDWLLKKVENDEATIESDGVLATVDKEKITALPNGIKSKIDLSGRQALVGKVRLASGWPSEMKLLSEIKGKMILLAGGMIPEDMDVPMEITTESRFTITKK